VRTNRRTLLADNSFGGPDGVAVEQLRVAENYAGYNLSSFGRAGTSSTVVVKNLRTGRTRRIVRRAGDPVQASIVVVEVTDLVLKPNGSVAWIYDIGESRSFPVTSMSRTIEVRKASRGTDISVSTLLDAGLTVDTRSLAVRGSTISWKNAGQLRTAGLR
jgi:translation elongation factor P/translation initiation factor 5A